MYNNINGLNATVSPYTVGGESHLHSRRFSVDNITEDMRTQTVFEKMFGEQIPKDSSPDAKGVRPEVTKHKALVELKEIIGDSYENHNCFVARRIDDILDEKDGKLEVSPEKSEPLEESKSSELEFTKFQLKYGLNSGEKEVILDEDRLFSFTSDFRSRPVKVK